MAEKAKEILKKEYTPLEKGLAVACTFFVGIIIGFVLSPVKKGIMFGSKNGCNNGSNNRNNSSSIGLPKKRNKKNRL